MRTIEKWLDVSRQSTGYALTLDQCQRIKADGYDGIVVQLWDALLANPWAQQTLWNARQAGLKTAAYIALNGSGADHVMSGYMAAGAEWMSLSFVAIDCEIDGITPDILTRALTEVLTEKQRPIIYTAKWWWTGSFGNSTAFSKWALWNVDNIPVIDYGGWTESVGEQEPSASTFSYGGPQFSADIDTFFSDFIDAAPGTVNGLLVLAQAWKDDMRDTVEGAGSLYNEGFAPDRLSMFAVRQLQKAQAWAAVAAAARGGK